MAAGGCYFDREDKREYVEIFIRKKACYAVTIFR